MRIATALFAILVSGVASAASLDIDGIYGNPAGCKYAADGIYGDDTVVMLEAESYQTAVMSCEFVQVLPATNGGKVVTMVCGHEGEGYLTIDLMRVAKEAGRDAYTTYSRNGDLWEEVRPCEPRNEQGR